MKMSLSSQKTTKSVPQLLYFIEVLKTVGVSIQYNENPNVFLKEQSLITRDLQQELEQHPNNPQNIDNFLTGLKHFVKNKDYFKKALFPSRLQRVSDDSDAVAVTGAKQENLFRVLLGVDCLQREIVSLILEEITMQAVAVEDGQNPISLKILLGVLRYLCYVKDAKKLTATLLEILEVATHSSQIEILYFIPDIIPDSEYDETAKHLSKLLNENTRLTNAIIDCLTHLDLCGDTITDIQDNILAILNSTSSLKTFLTIFRFLVTNCKPSNLSNILLKTRSALDSIMIHLSRDSESEQVLTFEEIGAITIKSKAISEAWITILNNIRSSKDHKSVDIIILLILHSTGSNRKHLVETIIKKKCKNQQIKSTLLETTLQKYLVPQLLKQYMKSILEIAACLLRLHTDSACLEFAMILYTTTFGHKHAAKQQREQMLNSLILLARCSDGKGAIPALSMLSAIAESHLQLLQPHTKQLMALLEKMEHTDLSEVKQIFDLLCALTCGPQADGTPSLLENEIQTIVGKLLSSAEKSEKLRGIIAAVATAKNIATVLDDQADLSEESYINISKLPTGPAKKAATLLRQASISTYGCPISLGLYYDQLSQMIMTTNHLDKYFLNWLLENINNNFQDAYITDRLPEPIDDLLIVERYKLNADDEIDSVFYINIAEVTVKSNQNNNAMLIFSPLFRLIRLILHVSHEGNLQTISALLGSGIAMPDIDPDVGVDHLSFAQSKQVVDCLFHCINWCREIVSAFVTQKSKDLRQKILKRINNLVELEALFLKCVKTVPDHKLPPSYFYNINLNNTIGSLHLGKSRKRSANANSTTRITQVSQAASTSKPGRKPQGKDKEVYDFQFREMDTDIIMLLKYSLYIGDAEPETTLYLTLPQFKFIINDLVTKLTKITKSNSATMFTHLVTVKPEDLITDCVELMPYINKHLIKIIDETKNLLEKTDGIHDAHDMFLQAATELKICLSLTLETLSLIFSWTGFKNSKHLPLLRKLLRALVDDESSQLCSAQSLINEFLKCVMVLTNYCLTLPCAVHLINIVKALCNVTPDLTPNKKLVLLSGKLLSTKWFNLHGLSESGAIANIHIDNLVKAHLNGSNIATISTVVSWIHTECSDLTAKVDTLSTFPCITKSNFPILYRAVCASLLDALQSSLKGATNAEHLDIWRNTAATMRELMAIVKIQESRPNLSAFLKKTLAIFKVFLSQGLPILEIMLRSHSTEVIEILRSLQQSTKFINNICCHSKVTKDSALIAHVPQMRLTLETLVYRVKAALIANNCSSAFWMGNLRNKNLKGEEIPSQSDLSQSEHGNIDQNDEDLLPDDDSDDETVASYKTGTSNKSVSIIF